MARTSVLLPDLDGDQHSPGRMVTSAADHRAVQPVATGFRRTPPLAATMRIEPLLLSTRDRSGTSTPRRAEGPAAIFSVVDLSQLKAACTIVNADAACAPPPGSSTRRNS